MKKYLLTGLIIVSLLLVSACNNPFWPGRDGENGTAGNTGGSGKMGDPVCMKHNWNWGAPFKQGEGLRHCINNGCTATAGIGDTGPGGGIIFHVEEGGLKTIGAQHGCWYLEAAPNDLASTEWGNMGNIVIDISTTEYSSGQFLGCGRDDTDRIYAHMNANGKTGTAAQLCKAVTEGVFPGHWFLPSIDELYLLYANNKQYKLFDNLSGTYWSSTQYDANGAWCKEFSDINTYTSSDKKEGKDNKVRAILAF